MRFALLLALLLAGCATPAPTPTPSPTPDVEDEGPFDVTGRMGLFLYDVENRTPVSISASARFGFISPSGRYLSWTEDTFAAVLDRETGARKLTSHHEWTRLYDNGTGLILEPRVARVLDWNANRTQSERALPDAPQGQAWSVASDDLSVLAGQYFSGVCCPPCYDDIFIHAGVAERTRGCSLDASPEGRLGWVEGGQVRIRARDGAITNLTERGHGAQKGDAYLDHSRPRFFGDDGVAYVRHLGTVAGPTIDSGPRVDYTASEIHVVDGGAPAEHVITLRDSVALLLLGVSDDARWILFSIL